MSSEVKVRTHRIDELCHEFSDTDESVYYVQKLIHKNPTFMTSLILMLLHRIEILEDAIGKVHTYQD